MACASKEAPSSGVEASMGCNNTTWLAAVRLEPEADSSSDSRSTKLADALLSCQSWIVLLRCCTFPCKRTVLMLNSSNAAATLRFKSSNCVNTMTFALLSLRRMSNNFFTTAANFVPYALCRGSNSVATGAASAGPADGEISSQTGRTSRCARGVLQMLHFLKFVTTSVRQLKQNVWAHGVMAMDRSGKLSSKQTVQLRVSGVASACSAESVRSKKARDFDACCNSPRGPRKASTSLSISAIKCRSGISFLLNSTQASVEPLGNASPARNL
mmetsp:Transcript_88791/g.247119  ORF Transcript_88791/g.247119 Transcript_88791/m.247119 type:complete len:271 (-) Transcript_88791:37-849(-)